MGVSEIDAMNEGIAHIMSMIRRLPYPPGEDIPPGATETEIEALEKDLGFTVPAALKEWLSVCDGPCVGAGGIMGINPRRRMQNIRYILGLHPEWKRKCWIPVAGDGCGNDYVILCSHRVTPQPVVFVDNAINQNAPAYVVASNFWRFLVFYLEQDEGKREWPFKREYVIKKDPDILAHRELVLPWET